MPTPDPVYLTLSQVATRTRRHPELLRQWCAGGRIPCLRVGGSWVLREQDLALVDGIAKRGRQPRTQIVVGDPARTRIIAAVFDDEASASAVTDALTDRLSVEPDAVGTTSLDVGGIAALRLTVVAGRFAEPDSVEARRILIGYGGRVVADIDEGAGGGASARGPRTVANAKRRAATVEQRGRGVASAVDRARPGRRSVPRAAAP